MVHLTRGRELAAAREHWIPPGLSSSSVPTRQRRAQNHDWQVARSGQVQVRLGGIPRENCRASEDVDSPSVLSVSVAGPNFPFA